MDFPVLSTDYCKAMQILDTIRTKLDVLKLGSNDEVLTMSISLDLNDFENILEMLCSENCQRVQEIQELKTRLATLEKQIVIDEWMVKINALVAEIQQLTGCK